MGKKAMVIEKLKDGKIETERSAETRIIGQSVLTKGVFLVTAKNAFVSAWTQNHRFQLSHEGVSKVSEESE